MSDKRKTEQSMTNEDESDVCDVIEEQRRKEQQELEEFQHLRRFKAAALTLTTEASVNLAMEKMK